MNALLLTTAIQNLVPNKPFVIKWVGKENGIPIGAVSDFQTLKFEDETITNPSDDDIVAEYNRLKTIEDNKTPTDTAKDKLKDLGFSDAEIEVII